MTCGELGDELPRSADTSNCQLLRPVSAAETLCPGTQPSYSKSSALFSKLTKKEYHRLDGREVWGRMDTCVSMAESLCCPLEAITTLLISYIPIQNLKKIKKEYQIAFTWIKQKCLFIVLSKENSLTLNQNMVQRNLDHLDILQNFTLTHFTNTILLSGPNEQKMVNIQKVLVRGMCPIGYGPSENASTWYICKIFRVQWLRTYWHIPFKIRGSTTKKKRRITMPNVISHIEHSSSPYSRQHERLPGLSGFKLWLRKDCSSF